MGKKKNNFNIKKNYSLKLKSRTYNKCVIDLRIKRTLNLNLFIYLFKFFSFWNFFGCTNCYLAPED